MSRMADELAAAQAAEMEKYRVELSTWQARCAELAARAVERGREAQALEVEMAKTITALADTEDEKKREELVFHWKEMRDLREITEAEREELARRASRLRSQPPPRVSSNAGMPTSDW